MSLRGVRYGWYVGAVSNCDVEQMGTQLTIQGSMLPAPYKLRSFHNQGGEKHLKVRKKFG